MTHRRHAELAWIENRLERLLLERGRAAIPELARPPCAVDEGRHMSRAELATDAASDISLVGERPPGSWQAAHESDPSRDNRRS